VESRHPDRLAVFVDDLARYERRLSMLGLQDEAIAALEPSGAVPSPGPLAIPGFVIGAPIAAYGWIHRLAPVWVIEWAVAKFSPPENRLAPVAHGSMIAGFVSFGLLYAAAAGLMWHFAGWKPAAVYLASLPLSGIFAFRYVRALHRYAGRLKGARILLRLPLTRRNLARTRERLVRQIELFRADYRRDVLKRVD
jgi:glycerol-3-phosphate O-acyltransferase/dihydroxyacetone phosphate acyltransferase